MRLDRDVACLASGSLESLRCWICGSRISIEPVLVMPGIPPRPEMQALSSAEKRIRISLKNLRYRRKSRLEAALYG